MNIVAIIPARGGSKSIPRKNLALLNGKPLVAHSIEHALQAASVTRVIVSTEDDEIAVTAERFGAEVPFRRPAALAADDILDLPVFLHALDWLETERGDTPDLLVHLRPTAPHRPPGSIDAAVQALQRCPEADSVRSVSPIIQHPYRAFIIGADGFLDPIMKHEHPVPHLLRRQDLPPVHYYNCVIDVTRPRTLREKKSMTGDKILPYLMDVDEVFDIDSPRDLEIARFLLER